jgi:hypothetical protein
VGGPPGKENTTVVSVQACVARRHYIVFRPPPLNDPTRTLRPCALCLRCIGILCTGMMLATTLPRPGTLSRAPSSSTINCPTTSWCWLWARGATRSVRGRVQGRGGTGVGGWWCCATLIQGCDM